MWSLLQNSGESKTVMHNCFEMHKMCDHFWKKKSFECVFFFFLLRGSSFLFTWRNDECGISHTNFFGTNWHSLPLIGGLNVWSLMFVSLMWLLPLFSPSVSVLQTAERRGGKIKSLSDMMCTAANCSCTALKGHTWSHVKMFTTCSFAGCMNWCTEYYLHFQELIQTLVGPWVCGFLLHYQATHKQASSWLSIFKNRVNIVWNKSPIYVLFPVDTQFRMSILERLEQMEQRMADITNQNPSSETMATKSGGGEGGRASEQQSQVRRKDAICFSKEFLWHKRTPPK